MQNRPLRDFEHGAHLHVLDWAHSTARQRFQHAGAAQVNAAAAALVHTDAYDAPPALPSLAAALHGELVNLYALGHGTVRSELDHQAHGNPLPIGLSSDPVTLAVPDTPDPAGLHARARLAAQHVAHQIHQVIARGRLQGILSTARLQDLGVAAGQGALSAVASSHAGGAIAAGRHAAALLAAPPRQVIGARYTSVLDKSTCGPCAAADTGELIALGSPQWIPTPNPACLGGDRCRCIHVYQLGSETGDPAAIAAARGAIVAPHAH